MNGNAPLLSIGIPVYNGERFIAHTIDSLLAQTFQDFELIISDNASTDGTEQICREYAAKDSRVRYHRSEQNRGAAWNHNRVVELAIGEYFKWHSHDDYCAPTFVEKCFAVIHNDPGVAMCYSQFVRVDDEGKRLGVKSSRVAGRAEVRERFRSLIYRRDSCEEIYGITRTEVIRKTALIGPYSNSDDTFLAELVLRGRFEEVPEPLFFYRIHQTQSTNAYPNRYDRMAWFDPSTVAQISLPSVKLLQGYFGLVRRSPLRWFEKIGCYATLLKWYWYFRDWLKEDLRYARFVFINGRMVPWFKKHAPWTRSIWHWVKSLRARLRRTESAAAKAKRERRAQLERWELKAEE